MAHDNNIYVRNKQTTVQQQLNTKCHSGLAAYKSQAILYTKWCVTEERTSFMQIEQMNSMGNDSPQPLQ